jgi:hypothetical protein
MEKYYPKEEKKLQREKAEAKMARDMSVNRFSGNAARLEHINVRNKNKSKKS